LHLKVGKEWNVPGPLDSAEEQPGRQLADVLDASDRSGGVRRRREMRLLRLLSLTARGRRMEPGDRRVVVRHGRRIGLGAQQHRDEATGKGVVGGRTHIGDGSDRVGSGQEVGTPVPDLLAAAWNSDTAAGRET